MLDILRYSLDLMGAYTMSEIHTTELVEVHREDRHRDTIRDMGYIVRKKIVGGWLMISVDASNRIRLSFVPNEEED